MKPTKEELAKKYNEYNVLYFNGKLQQLTKNNFFYINKNSTQCGRYSYKKDKNGKIINQIWIGTCIEWNEERLMNVLVHEMIHMYNVTVEHSRFNGIFGHGRSFRKQCRRIKKEFGITIHIHCNYEQINKMPPPSFLEKAFVWLIDR